MSPSLHTACSIPITEHRRRLASSVESIYLKFSNIDMLIIVFIVVEHKEKLRDELSLTELFKHTCKHKKYGTFICL